MDSIPANLDPQVASSASDIIACENLYSGLVRRKMCIRDRVEVERSTGRRENDDVTGLCAGAGQLNGVLHVVGVLEGQRGLVEVRVFAPVSYTHLDVYKRQGKIWCGAGAMLLMLRQKSKSL